MDGIHDLGGMDGFGPVRRDDAVFHAPWERRAFGLMLMTAIDGNTDDLRHAIERLDPGTYVTAGYYGRWLAALEVRLRERELVDSDEVDVRCRDPRARPEAVASVGLGRRDPPGGPVRAPLAAARFGPGDRVRARDLHPVGHTRLPRYVRGRAGTVARRHPAFVFPDTNAHGRGEDPQHVYAVRFLARDLWGDGDHVVHVDLFESYLEPA